MRIAQLLRPLIGPRCASRQLNLFRSFYIIAETEALKASFSKKLGPTPEETIQRRGVQIKNFIALYMLSIL